MNLLDNTEITVPEDIISKLREPLDGKFCMHADRVQLGPPHEAKTGGFGSVIKAKYGTTDVAVKRTFVPPNTTENIQQREQYAERLLEQEIKVLRFRLL